MIEVSDEVIEQMVKTIVNEVSPEQIILFGSRAKNQSHPDSDVDLLIIENEPFGKDRSRKEETGKLWRALAHFQVPLDILLYSRHEVDYWRDSLNNVVARALREGKVLYERP
ncbi:MAG: nucleotidyltransferase domain-containing protein [Gemmatimonadota bacterium]|nr:nucleotidyltransferase domain-containing protein [Gemmatimonadota bacterium]